MINDELYVDTVDPILFDAHRSEFLAPMTYTDSHTYIVKYSKKTTYADKISNKGHNRRRLQVEPIRPPDYQSLPTWDTSCQSVWQGYAAMNKGICFAVALEENAPENTKMAYPIIRVDFAIDELGHDIQTVKTLSKEILARPSYTFYPNEHNTKHVGASGYYRKIPQFKGRDRLQEKLEPLLRNFDSINNQITDKFKERGIKANDDVVIMVINEGEVDLFYNFICSCRLHSINVGNVVVFSGSEEIIPIIESSGAMGLYHVGYSAVSRKASMDYLDRIFVDMMWYKAFSIYLILRLKINILFQDVDIVWFRDPFPWFKDYTMNITARTAMTGASKTAFFSDDGQRALRYAPYYSNSGFYYLLANNRSEYFAWSIMTAFDTVQRLGSHQNVLVTRLQEGLSLSHSQLKILPIDDFPTGMLYHHDKAYMDKLYGHQIRPYGFHMCWTQGKTDKLKYLRKASMWYLHEQCSPLEAYLEGGKVFNMASNAKGGVGTKVLEYCCIDRFTKYMP